MGFWPGSPLDLGTPELCPLGTPSALENGGVAGTNESLAVSVAICALELPSNGVEGTVSLVGCARCAEPEGWRPALSGGPTAFAPEKKSPGNWDVLPPPEYCDETSACEGWKPCGVACDGPSDSPETPEGCSPVSASEKKSRTSRLPPEVGDVIPWDMGLGDDESPFAPVGT